MTFLKKLWHNISFSGLNNSIDSEAKKKIILCNRIAILAGLTISLAGVSFIKEPVLFYITLCSAFIYTTCIFFNKLKWYNFSRFILVIVPPLLILLRGALSVGTFTSTYRYALLSVIITPILLFQLSEKVKMWIGTIWVVLCFVFYDYITHFIARLLGLIVPAEINSPILVPFGGVVSMVIFIMAFIYLMDINRKSERRLAVILKNTKEKNRLISEKTQLLQEQYQAIQKQQEEIQQMNQILKSQILKAQMNPHFIFNCLNSIQHFIMQSDASSAMGYMSKFSKLMRQVLENSANENVSIADEIKTLTYYIELEQLRYSNNFDFEFVIDEQIDHANTEIPSMLLQPFVENAIVHGLRNKKAKGNLKIVLLYQHERILCIIEDNGIGRIAAEKLKHAKNTFHKSRAIDINTKRLYLMQSNASIITNDLVDDEGNVIGTRVEISIPTNY